VASAPGPFGPPDGAVVHERVVVAAPGDIDDLEHVSNLVYLRWVQEVAIAHSEAVGWSGARYRVAGAAFMVRRHELDYLASVREGQQVVLRTWIAWWRGASSERRTELVRAADGVVAARAVTLWAFVDLATGRPRRIPEDVHRAFAVAAG
jgi:acyl-CoA thioester hydrolase